MYSMNRFGQNRPMCNTRQFVTIGIINHQPEEMRLKPEYLDNEHFKFVNNFGLQSQIIPNKQFVDINNSVNQSHTDRMALNPQRIHHSVPNTVMVNRTAAYHTHSGSNFHKEPSEKSSLGNIAEEFTSSVNIQSKEDPNKSTMVTNKHEKVSVCDNGSMKAYEDPCIGNNMKVPKKTKRSSKMHCDKTYQKQPSKKSKRQKNFHKQSKRESDRNIIGNLQSSRKRKNCKPWHKQSLKMEIVDLSDIYFCSASESNLDSPIITSFHNPSLPTITSVCIQNKINSCLSSPVKVNSESTIQSQKQSPSGFTCEERRSDAHQSMGYPSQQNNCQSPRQNNYRPRLPSECESEDSFIIFEEDSKSTDLEDRDSSDFDMSSDEDSDDSDIDFCITVYNQNNHRLKTSSPEKKVRFAVGKDLCEVHPMVQWSFAYQKARKGPWEQFAVDRMRFKNRVSDVQPVLDIILQPAHRDKVYRERFQHDSSDEN